MTRIRTRLAVALTALGTALGLTLAATTPAQAISEGFTNGYVTHILNDWGAGIGVWASDPPGQGPADELWYPVYGDTTWTEPVAINIGAGWECEMTYYGYSSVFYVSASKTADYHYPVGNLGRKIITCYQY